MGIVACPHVVVCHVKNFCPENADAILLECGVDLPFDVFTRQSGQFGRIPCLRFSFPEGNIHFANKGM